MSEQDYGHVDWTPKTALEFYAAGKHFDVVDGRTRIIDTGAIASDALKQLSTEYAQLKGLTTQDYSALQSQVRQLASALERLSAAQGEIARYREALSEDEREAIQCAAYAQDAWASDLSDHGYTTRDQRRHAKTLHALADRLSALDSKKCPKCYGSKRVPDPDGYGLESLPCPDCAALSPPSQQEIQR